MNYSFLNPKTKSVESILKEAEPREESKDGSFKDFCKELKGNLKMNFKEDKQNVFCIVERPITEVIIRKEGYRDNWFPKFINLK